MPRYDYRCVECDYQFELVQSFQEAGQGACPLCAGAGRRVYYAPPVIYKGSGFYTTDYGRPKPPAENGAARNGSGDSAKSDDAGSGASSGGGESSGASGGESSGGSGSEAATAAAGASSGSSGSGG